jgi:hypothetical protein
MCDCTGSTMTEAMTDMDTILAGRDDQVRTNILILDACRNNPWHCRLLPPGQAAPWSPIDWRHWQLCAGATLVRER